MHLHEILYYVEYEESLQSLKKTLYYKRINIIIFLAN